MYTLVLLRHGESTWNKENRFTGWTDVDLSQTGRAEAAAAGKMLAEKGYGFDLAYTSVLKRAIRTLWITLDQLDAMWVPVHHSWRLNERHYGALQGLNKSETAAKYGEDQVLKWRRGYAIRPPVLENGDERLSDHDPRYADLSPEQLPRTESLADCLERVLPLWNDSIAPDIRTGKRILIAAHGNSLRALIKHLDSMSEASIVELNIPTGIPLVYELDMQLKPIRHFYLADDSEVAAKLSAVKVQGAVKQT